MLQLGTLLIGYRIDATDGAIGTLNDLLFDDANWGVRWLRIESGGFFPGQSIVVPPSMVARVDHAKHRIVLSLTKEQFAVSPASQTHLPVSRQNEATLHDYDCWNQMWVAGGFGGGAMASPLSSPPIFGEAALQIDEPADFEPIVADPHLRSVAAMIDYSVLATNGALGQVKDLVVDDHGWFIPCLVIGTDEDRPQVVISSSTVSTIDFGGREIRVALTQSEIRDCPNWEPAVTVDTGYDDQLVHPVMPAQILAVNECTSGALAATSSDAGAE